MNSEVLNRSTADSSAQSRESASDWLAWLSELLTDRQWLGLYEFESDADAPLHKEGYPAQEPAPKEALALARKARQSGKPLAIKLARASEEADGESSTVITLTALPLNKECNHVLLIKGASQTKDQQGGMFRLARWAGEKLDLFIQPAAKESSPEENLESLPSAVLQASFQYSTPDAMAMSIVNTVKRLCGCARVTLATLDTDKRLSSLTIKAMSDQAQIDTRKVLPSQLKAALQERFIGENLSRYSSENMDTHRARFPASARLFSEQGENPSLSVVYPDASNTNRASLIGKKSLQSHVVILLERPRGQPFTDVQQKAIDTLLAPSLDLLTRRMDESRSNRLRIKQYVKRRLNHQYFVEKGIKRPGLTFAVGALAFSLLIPIEHRFTASASIEAKDVQVLIAPQNGFVATSHARAGETVKKGQLLATLDTQDLSLTVNKWRTEKIKNEQAVDLALATRDRVSLGRLRADTARIDAEQALVERQLQRAELRAPFDGVVLSGDFSQLLGSSVTQGSTLFTIAASNEYRLVLDIKEQDVGLVKPGQRTDVRMSALPNQTWHANMDSVLPVATTTADANVFRVPARLTEHSDALLPGMEGVAKIHAGKHSLAWVYTRGLREKLKVVAWRLGLIR